MGENINKRLKISNVWYYALFLLAFVFFGFTFNSNKVAAAPVVSIPTDDYFNYNEGLTFYGGYDVITITKVKYRFNDGDWITIGSPDTNYSAIYKGSSAKNFCNSKSFFDKCTDVILAYKIPVSGLPTVATNSNYNDTSSNGKFKVEVTIENKRMGLGGSTTQSAYLTYDNKAPIIEKIDIGRNDALYKDQFKIGETVKFTVKFNEYSYVANGVKLSFEIGGSQKTASCNASLYSRTKSIACTYTVASSDSGNFGKFKVVNANKIKDLYNNSISSSTINVSDYSNDDDLTVDGVKPYIVGVVADNGVFSSDTDIQVSVIFSEELYNYGSDVAPVLNIKIGEGIEKKCDFYSVDVKELIYRCKPEDDDQGVLKFISISGGNDYSDYAGNGLNLSKSSFEISTTKIDNNLPAIDKVSTFMNGCTSGDGNIYCKTNDKIIVEFLFNINVTFESKNVKLLFNGVNAKNSFTQSYDEASKKLKVSYVVSDQDNGLFSLSYYFEIRGENGKLNTISSTKEFNYYVDNGAPKIDSNKLEIFSGDEKVVGDVVYTKINGTISFKIPVSDSSDITVDSEKIYFINELDEYINVCDECEFKELNSKVEDGFIVILVVLNKDNYKEKIRLKLLKDSVSDYFGNVLEEDFISSLFVVDGLAPEYEVSVVYPEYNSYYDGNKWLLVGGNTIEFKITSDDVDLDGYCSVISLDDICEEYYDFVVGNIYSYDLEEIVDGENSFYIRVRDKATNVTNKLVKFNFKNIFEYSNGINQISNHHSINVNVSLFEDGTNYKYGWFKKGNNVSFNSANVTSKHDDVITIEGQDNYYGEYRVCINRISDNLILCSGYVNFDTKIDKFEVNINNEWTNKDIVANIVFNDVSTIKCVAIGKNVSTPKCSNNTGDVVVYKTSQAISPLNKYVISENGVYYFYIEDAIGNTSLISKSITNIDKKNIKIDIYNGSSNNFNENLEVNVYKNEHKFLLTFDKDINEGSTHKLYRYFFTPAMYLIKDKDNFNNYYIKSLHHGELTNCNKSWLITTPLVSGVYNLYIMSEDKAGNVSLANVNGIEVDAIGPTITMYDSNNIETNGGSSSYISAFDYSFVIEDYDSKLDLNQVYYRWLDSSNGSVVFEKKYDSCPFDYNMCRIKGDNIEFGKDIFEPSKSYKLEVSAKDNAGNVSTFATSSFKIDTTAPVININVDENKWYNKSSYTFTVSKENNIGTLSEIGYCLNDCLIDEEYDLSKFNNLVVSNPTNDIKIVTLELNDGINKLYVYASDVFGNYRYKDAKINYDSVAPGLTINNIDENNNVDLSFEEEAFIDFIVVDMFSGIKNYCVYINDTDKDCYEGNNQKEIPARYKANVNGVYYIETMDSAGNTTVHTINVMGVDAGAISFDLITNMGNSKFTNGDVKINIVNMRKFMVENVNSIVNNIDYVVLDYNSHVYDYDSLFVGEYTSVYNKNINNELITSFNVNSNALYVVRIIDDSNNASYNYIRVNNIDNTKPIINTNKYGNGEDRIYVNSTNMRVDIDGTQTIYKYSNDIIKVYFGEDSLKDASTGFNNYLGIKVCFEDVECMYNTYNVDYFVRDGYLINREINVSAPYNFSGIIRYYLVDGAGNESSKYEFKVVYQSEVSQIDVKLEDANGNDILETSKYNYIKVVFSGEDMNDILNNYGLKYALKDSRINMYNEFANRTSTIDSFLNHHGFVDADAYVNDISKNNVDDSYYLWVFVRDLLNNYKLIKVETLINIDTKTPEFEELMLNVNKVDSASYDLVAMSVDKYSLYISYNGGSNYDEVRFEDNKYSFVANGVSSILLKLVDEAGNFTTKSVNLADLTTESYAKVYQISNQLKANVVVYNLGSKNITNFRYILTSLNSIETFDENSINDSSIQECNGYEETCKSSEYTLVSKGEYRISLSEDKRVIFYIEVNNVLIDLVDVKLYVDNKAPIVEFSYDNPNLISTINGVYNFNVNISDDNLSSSINYKYMFTTNSNINVSSFSNNYNSCNNNVCARGTFENYIDVNSNSNQFSRLNSGNYYLYVYAEDKYGNIAVSKSNVITVDNTYPLLSYAVKSNSGTYRDYTDVNGDLFVGGAAKIRFSDSNLSHFEIYSRETLVTRCYVNSVNNDLNCVKTGDGEIGFVKDNNYAYYYLDNGNYLIKAYDSVNNVNNLNVSIDNGDPLINLYKKVEENYEIQNSSRKVFNSLNDLYINVIDSNFSYLTIDLVNTKTNETTLTAVRHSFNSEVGQCLSNATVCQYGMNLVNMISDNTISYNKIIVKAYDKANRVSIMEINYDDGIPSIWIMNVGESVYINSILYTIKEGMIINVEIGVNNQLTLDKLLEKVILDVDGMGYQEAKTVDTFTIGVYKESSLFDGNPLDHIGEYSIVINYRDEAGNKAESKTINIKVSDNVKPELEIIDSVNKVETNKETVLKGVEVKDNYGLYVESDILIKKSNIGLNQATCRLVVDGVTKNCSESMIKLSNDMYKFIESGIYSFVYAVSDISGNTSTITQTITVSDISGPLMTSNEQMSRIITIGNRKADASIDVNNISFSYPTSYDSGDGNSKDVTYLGLFSINNMNEKYKLMNDGFKISDVNKVLTYKFSKVGTYYLRFTSRDDSGNVSIFEYEVKVVDELSPVIEGISDGVVIEVGLDETFDVQTNIIDKYEVVANDNYDSNVKIYYEIKNGTNHTYEVTLNASDSSSNVATIVVYVDVVDEEAPISGELQLDEITSNRALKFNIIGGEDNSSNFWHEFKVDGKEWTRYDELSVLEFGEGLNLTINVCVRAVDFAGNVSANSSCKTIIVDTKAPVVSGVASSKIYDKEVTISVTDDRLASVKVIFNDEVKIVDLNQLPFTLSDVGTYSLVAKDTLGNETVVNFVISIDSYMNVVNDIQAEEYVVSSIEFDELDLIKTNMTYDDNGDLIVNIKSNDISVNDKDLVYILGVIPNTNNSFIILSVSGAELKKYSDTISLISEGDVFKETFNNEDCFLKINESYYAYLAIRENAVEDITIAEDEKENNNGDKSKTMKTTFIIVGSAVVAILGYQIIKFKRKVRSA